MPSIIVHGGAGAYDPGAEHERGLVAAARAGWVILAEGGSAVDAAEAAVVVMEDDPLFNAGYGSSLTLAGAVECDASIMLSDYSAGGVAALRAAKNPIRAARLVMERTDHVLLAGAGADEFAGRMGLPAADLRSERRLRLHEENLAKLCAGEDLKFMPRIRGLADEMGIGTVGVAALDAGGTIAAATSTGGLMMKLPGRVGDGAVIGAGTYATPWAGVSATGHGEPIMRHALGKVAVGAAREMGIRQAIEMTLEIGLTHGFGFGIVGVEENGAVAHGFTTQGMSWVSIRDWRLETFLGTSETEPGAPGDSD
jgi:beta-aspartyl-peptidase (threonine type)